VVSRRIEPRDLLPWFASSHGDERFYWESAEDDLAFATRGAAASIESAGEQRFASVAERARELVRTLRFDAEGDPAPSGPWLVGGFGFADEEASPGPWEGFPPARWVLPERIVVRRGSEAWAMVTQVASSDTGNRARVERLERARRKLRDLEREIATQASAWQARAPSASGPHDRAPFRCDAGGPHSRHAQRGTVDARDRSYEARVRSAVESVRAGALEKVVVARAVRCPTPAIEPGEVLDALRSRHRGCRIFALARAGAWFLGASPERLIRVDGGRVAVDALAGSAPRGRTAAEDARLGRQLVESKKEQEEHAIVVRFLRAALARRCRDLQVLEAPLLKRLSGIQHLHTPITARLPEDHRFALLDLLPALHPTPAVAGAPRAAALAWLRRHEGFTRGWYGGLVGWLDARGEGELAVALRSALIRSGEAHLFAGAGIVAESDPEAEVEETRLKLRSAAEALGMLA
jgi:isochorismate synthase